MWLVTSKWILILDYWILFEWSRLVDKYMWLYTQLPPIFIYILQSYEYFFNSHKYMTRADITKEKQLFLS